MTVRVGVDVGGTGVKAACVDVVSGALVSDRRVAPTPHPGHPEAVVGVVRDLVAGLDAVGAVGVTFPGVVVRGTVHTAANLDPAWIGLDGAACLGEATGRAVHLLNDADAAGIAEMRVGAGRGRAGVVLVITFGTGIGSALFVDGTLVPNTEFGHLELDGADAEWRASGAARTREGLSWATWAARVERYLRHLDALLWPDLVIVGGGMSAAAAEWLPLVSVRCEIVPASLRNDAGIVGAALVAYDTESSRTG